MLTGLNGPEEQFGQDIGTDESQQEKGAVQLRGSGLVPPVRHADVFTAYPLGTRKTVGVCL